MKVRWRRGSFRLRITPSELAMLEGGRSFEESLDLPGGSWTVSVQPGTRSEVGARGTTIAVALAAVDVRRLAQPDIEGVYFRTDAPAEIDWFVEKDFPCAHPRPPGVREEPTESFDAPPRFAERHRGACDGRPA